MSMKTSDVQAFYDKYVIGNYRRAPIAVVRGEGLRIWDAYGKKYLDFLSGLGVNGLGYCPPRVVAAVQKQAARLMHIHNNYLWQEQAVLAKVAALPLTQWNYRTDKSAVQHIGPMAQDFQAAFGLDGADDKHISVVDEGGVALAAIQGLNEKLQAELKRQDAENAKLREQNDALVQRLDGLEAALKALADKT